MPELHISQSSPPLNVTLRCYLIIKLYTLEDAIKAYKKKYERDPITGWKHGNYLYFALPLKEEKDAPERY